MVVPYGDPSWLRWNIFDAGYMGLGKYGLSPLVQQADAPDNALYLNAAIHDEKGMAITYPRAMALYERFGGTLWRHGPNARPATQLVLISFARIDNYDYGFSWIFHQDGTLETEVMMSGFLFYRALAPNQVPQAAEPHFNTLVAPGIAGPVHQHWFNFRLDLDIDGPLPNSVFERNLASLEPGPQNPHGNAVAIRETLLKREAQAQRPINMAAQRRWKVVNTQHTNALGSAPGYLLMPGANSRPYALENSFLRTRAGFVNAHVWVTPYRLEEEYAAGAYLNQTATDRGLAQWTQANRSIENQDIVVWYSLGITHVPRPEEWPLMPVHKAGFKLVPVGFFKHNPAMVLPLED